MYKKTARTFTLIIILILLSIFLTGCTYESKTQVVNAIVIDKKYVESQTKYGYYFDAWKGDFRWKFKTFPAEYNITVQYEDIVKTYDSETLYETYEIDDIIEMDLITYYDEEGNIQSRTLSRRQ